MWIKIVWHNRHGDEGSTIIPLPDGHPCIVRPRRAPLDGDPDGEFSRLWWSLRYSSRDSEGQPGLEHDMELNDPCSVFLMDGPRTVDRYNINPTHPRRAPASEE